MAKKKNEADPEIRLALDKANRAVFNLHQYFVSLGPWPKDATSPFIERWTFFMRQHVRFLCHDLEGALNHLLLHGPSTEELDRLHADNGRMREALAKNGIKWED